MVLTQSWRSVRAIMVALVLSAVSLPAQDITPKDSVLRAAGSLGFRVRYTFGQRYPVIDSVIRGRWASEVGVRPGDSLIAVGNLAPMLAKWGFAIKDTISIQIKRAGNTMLLSPNKTVTLWGKDSTVVYIDMDSKAMERNKVAALADEYQARARAMDTLAVRLRSNVSTQARKMAGDSVRYRTDQIKADSLRRMLAEVQDRVKKVDSFSRSLARAQRTVAMQAQVDSVSRSIARVKSALASSTPPTAATAGVGTNIRKVGTSTVEVRGASTITQDPDTKVLTIRVGSTVIVIKPE